MLRLCSPQLGISPDTNSGGEVYDREVLKSLAKLGVKIEIILPKNRSYEKSIKNWNVTHLPIKTIFPPYIFNLFLIPYLFRVFKKSKFQILRVHSPYFVGPAALAFRFFKKNIPVVASYLHLENKNIIFTFIDKLLIDKFDHIITISQATKKEIINKHAFPEERITVTYPGIDPKFKPTTKDKKLLKKFNLNNKKIVLYLGGLKFRKNVSFLLDLVKDLDSNAALLICGEGNAKLFLNLKALFLGISDRVEFAGYIPEDKKVDFYNLCDVFLVPSKKEGFGMISVEAQACGKPVLVSDSSSLSETLIDGKTGFICKAGDKKNWLEKLTILLRDDNLREIMGERAQEFVQSQFSWKKSAQRQKKIFEKLVSQNA